MAGSACMSTRASSDTKRYAVSVAGSANGKVRLQHERIALDEDLIASLNVRIYRFQIEDLIGRSIRARGKNSRVQAAFRVNSSTGEIELDILRKRTAPSDIRACPYEVKG